MTRVLVVDDEPQLLRAPALNLSTRGYEVSTAATAPAALDEISDFAPDLLILDLGLPDLDGLEVIREVRSSRPELLVVLLSARTDSEAKVAALELGAGHPRRCRDQVDLGDSPGCLYATDAFVDVHHEVVRTAGSWRRPRCG